VLVAGVGAVGIRAARQLASTESVSEVLLYDRDRALVSAARDSIGESRAQVVPSSDPDRVDAEVVVLAGPSGSHAALASRWVERGRHVVSTSDSLDDILVLTGLDNRAQRHDVSVAVAAGMAPGLSCLLAAHAAATLDVVEEVYVAKLGTAGPACARQHHAALGASSLDWRDGEWVERRGASGRELCWFPDPIGGADCYPAAMGDAWLLQPVFPDAIRVAARMAATRRDRITSRLPMLRKPHPEGALGGVRVELRGSVGPRREVRILGAIDRPGVASGAVAAVTAVALGEGRALRTGAAGIGELLEPLAALQALARRGVKAATFIGG
jgi:hypothetical protein